LKSYYLSQPIHKKITLIILSILSTTTISLMLIYHKKLFNDLIELSDFLESYDHTSLIIWFAMFFVSFPPMIGYTALSTLTGILFGLNGWFLIASSSVLGSTVAFIIYKFCFKNYSLYLSQKNVLFNALSQVFLEEKRKILLLALIKISPFPYSLLNGALASIQNITVLQFFLASAITTPKLVFHLFIGLKLKNIGSDEDNSSKFLDLLAIIIAISSFSLLISIVYTKTKKKLLLINSNN
ncbi:Tvp38p ASCRUDRAFT_18959, partial [Ascoidea rubescens DSM 1968]